jgi:hypothetical protein
VSGWPPWRRAQPAQLPRYVHTGVLATVLRPQCRLPGRSGAPPEVRVRQLFEAFAAAGVRYADEPPTAVGEQDIRTPDQKVGSSSLSGRAVSIPPLTRGQAADQDRE